MAERETPAPEAKGLKKSGAPSLAELKCTPGFPSEDALKQGPLAVIECVQEIPCNPCETACPQDAIKVGRPITRLPVLLAEKCQGCGLCVAACPGLAVYIKDYTHEPERALITFPFEYLPLPAKGETVTMINRLGEPVCPGEIVRINRALRNDRTTVVSAAFDKHYFHEVVSMKRLQGR